MLFGKFTEAGEGISKSGNASVEASVSMGDEVSTNADEPPDESNQVKSEQGLDAKEAMLSFGRSSRCEQCPKQSLLTQALTSDESHDDENLSQLGSNASTASTELTSCVGAADSAHNADKFGQSLQTKNKPSVRFQNDPKVSQTSSSVYQNSTGSRPALQSTKFLTEQNVSRRRCIRFACADTKTTENSASESFGTEKAPNLPSPPKRTTSLTFVCPPKNNNAASTRKANCKTRTASPAPRKRLISPPESPTSAVRRHRSSETTVKNNLPRQNRRSLQGQRSRTYSGDSDLARSSLYRFHEFASSEEEIDDWVQESSCHRSRLTINDTLKLENGLRKLGEEVEEEVLEDEIEDDESDDESDDDENDDDDESDDDDEEDDDDDEDEEEEKAESDHKKRNSSHGKINHMAEGERQGRSLCNNSVKDDISEGGFQTDDEDGFAASDDDEQYDDAHSDYEWWAPARASTTAAKLQDTVHIRPLSSSRVSDSSASSFSDPRLARYSTTPLVIKKDENDEDIQIKPSNPLAISQKLPDSTDFVCGTLDEDRPLEDAFKSCLEKQRMENHKPVPQDIDPTFPTSDPELDDDDDKVPETSTEKDNTNSGQHLLLHGPLDHHDDIDGITRPRNLRSRSSTINSNRLKSPPPSVRLAAPKSPPHQKSGHHSPRRYLSPPPPIRHSRPAIPKRHTTTTVSSNRSRANSGVTNSRRPPIIRTSSLPRTSLDMIDNFNIPGTGDDSSDVDETSHGRMIRRSHRHRTAQIHRRGAIDIVKGLERKRQYRKEKLYQKRCREIVNNKDNKHRDRPKQQQCTHSLFYQMQPGKGAEKMKEIGMELAACGRGRYKTSLFATETAKHIISI